MDLCTGINDNMGDIFEIIREQMEIFSKDINQAEYGLYAQQLTMSDIVLRSDTHMKQSVSIFITTTRKGPVGAEQ